jgi:hypothetical protein
LIAGARESEAEMGRRPALRPIQIVPATSP